MKSRRGAPKRVKTEGYVCSNRECEYYGITDEAVHAHFFRELVLEHVQLDELRTKVRRKARELWVWGGLDVGTKIIPVLKLGPRTQVMAYAMVHKCDFQKNFRKIDFSNLILEKIQG